jgi:CheY-like chemotaxis protein
MGRFRPSRKARACWNVAYFRLQDSGTLCSVKDLRRRVLVIDDQPGFRAFLQRILEVDGYRVEVADDGDSGLLALANAPEPCVVLVDLLMPRVNGMRFLSRLRDRYGAARFPVIVISALFGAEDAEPPEFPGVRGVIGKPFEPRVVRAAVHHAWAALEQQAA